VKGQALAVLAAALLLAGCASRPTATVSPTPTTKHTAPLLSKSFGSTVGLDVRYPTNWWLELLSVGHGRERDGAVELYTRGRRDTIRLMTTQPGFYRLRNADGHDLARMCAVVANRHDAVLQAGIVTIDRVLLAEVEHERGGWHYLTLTSGRSSATRKAERLNVTAVCPIRQWPAQRATVMAILDSMRFFGPGA
jgi:hypothetical protein